MRSFLRITDFTADEITRILDRADVLQQKWKQGEMPSSLKGKKIGLWFWGNGFRNRVAFEIGAQAMGAITSFIPGDLGVHEPLEDIGHYLNNCFDMLVLRCKNHDDLLKVSNDLRIPLINARTDYNHPCEIIGDLQFIRQKRGTIENLKVVFIGEATNLCMSWFEAAVRLPISVTQIAPKGYELSDAKVAEFNKNAIGRIDVSNDLHNSINEDIDLIYTDCWPRGEDKGKIKELFLPYQVTLPILDRINKKGFFLPCPPVTRGEEVSEESLRSRLCADYEAKDCLLHSQNAIMEFIFSESGD